MRRTVAGLALAALVGLAAPSAAAPSPATVTTSRPSVSWSGTLAAPDLVGCGEAASIGCDTTSLTVVAPKGSWITVSINASNSYVRVTDGTRYVASNGDHVYTLRDDSAGKATTTFQHVRSGRVAYTVGVSALYFGTAGTYVAKATLAGKAFDRSGECFVKDSGLGELTGEDDGAVLPLSIRLVSDPSDAAEVRLTVKPAVVETFARIGVAARVSLDTVPLRLEAGRPSIQVRAAYGGLRPAGVDVVHVVSDFFQGGFADCLGGIMYPDKAFSTGSLHYAPEGTVRQPLVYAAEIAVHEIGHLLGGQHQMGNCVEALPQQAVQPASDGSIGPCTVMSPGASQLSETFSTFEKKVMRAYVRRYAKH